MKPVVHPSTFRRFQDAAERLNQIRREHQRSTEREWAGGLLLNFDADELALLNKYGYLSERDRALLRKAGRPVQGSGE